jgi:hypothetical protein
MDEPSYYLQDRDDKEPSRISDSGKFAKREKIIKGQLNGEAWISYKGTFSMEMLYKIMFETLKRMGYEDQDGSGDKFEHYYSEKRGPDGFIGEIWYWWRTVKEGEKFRSTNAKYIIDIDVQILGMKESSITVDGNKFKMKFGEFNLFFRPFVEIPMIHEKSSGIMKSVMEWWSKRVYKSQIDNRKNECYNEANEIYGIIKQFLDLEHYTKIPQEFHPPKGVPTYKL